MLSKNEQLILMEMLILRNFKKPFIIENNGIKLKMRNKGMEIDDQKIIDRNVYFYRVMKKLEKNHLITSKLLKGSNKKVYFLTSMGYMLANVLGCLKSTPDKYREIAREIEWLP